MISGLGQQRVKHLTIASNATLNLSGNSFNFSSCSLTNSGTVVLDRSGVIVARQWTSTLFCQ